MTIPFWVQGRALHDPMRAFVSSLLAEVGHAAASIRFTARQISDGR